MTFSTPNTCVKVQCINELGFASNSRLFYGTENSLQYLVMSLENLFVSSAVYFVKGFFSVPFREKKIIADQTFYIEQSCQYGASLLSVSTLDTLIRKAGRLPKILKTVSSQQKDFEPLELIQT